MPNLRTHVAVDRGVLADTATYELDLKGFSGISAIDIVLRATNGVTMNQGVPIWTDIDTIEVVDGSRVVYSLTGVQARCLNCFETGKYPTVTYDEQAAAVQEETFRVSFGRHLGDEEYWFDPSTYQNPRLRVTVTLTISATAGFATGTVRITPIVHTWDSVPGGRAGTFMTKEFRNFTSAASGDEPTTLPRDFPHRLMVVRAFETAIAPHTDITQLKWTLDNDGYVVADLRTEQLRDVNIHQFGQFEIPQILFRTDADTPAMHMAYIQAAQVSALQQLDVASFDALTADQLTVQLVTLAVTPTIALSTTDRALLASVRGYAPHHALALPFGDLMDPTSWLNASDWGKFELILTQGGAGAAVSIFGQQVIP